MWKIALDKGDQRLFLVEEYSTFHQALRASFSRPVLEALELLDYDLCSIVEV